MSKNPVINAFGALVYIFLVVTVMNKVTEPLRYKPDTFMAPIVALSLLTLSVVVMAYMFFYQPIQMFIKGKKKEAVNLVVKTTGVFAVLTALVMVGLAFGL